jgi:hypothetical protein
MAIRVTLSDHQVTLPGKQHADSCCGEVMQLDPG